MARISSSAPAVNPAVDKESGIVVAALANLNRRRQFRRDAERLYGVAVNQARHAEFYAALGVPDTLDGRFDMIVLHVFLLLHRLKREGPTAARLAQALFDVMFADMDQNLREIGVGDLSVGRKVKSMAKALYGRCAAYEEGLAEGDGPLAAALRRNLFRGASPSARQLSALCAYMRREDAALAARSLAALSGAGPAFGPPPSLSRPPAAD
jgi:cytochrome b pre-mRNA-processing protein 3